MKQSTITEYGCTRSPGVLIFTDAILASIQNKKRFIFNEFFSDAWSGKDSHGERLRDG